MRVLIVGCGYVGRQVGSTLAHQGHQVFGLRRSSEGERELRAAGVVPFAGDISKPGTLELLPGPFEWIVNTASAGPGGVASYTEVYLEGTRNLVKALRGSPMRKYVYTSSTGVYSQDDGSQVDETSPAVPQTETGKVLAATEQLLLESTREHGFPAVILRVAGIYGPGRGYWLQQFLAGRAALEGDGGRYVNMIHRDDVAGCIIAALGGGRPGEIYNAVDDEPVTQRELFEWLSKTLRKPMPGPAAPSDLATGKRGVTNKRVSNKKLKRELGYAFIYPTFREGYLAEIQRLGGSSSKQS